MVEMTMKKLVDIERDFCRSNGPSCYFYSKRARCHKIATLT